VERKVMHGQYFKSIDRQLVSEDDMFVWMLRGDMKAETGSEIISAQGQALQTKYHATKGLQIEMEFEKIVNQIIS
jgi:hypothetical protein